MIITTMVKSVPIILVIMATDNEIKNKKNISDHDDYNEIKIITIMIKTDNTDIRSTHLQ